MDRVARLHPEQRSELFSETAARMGMTPAVVEKDFWVTWVLDCLFQHPELAQQLRFKGGTSLSKAYGLIERFSEDIDLILDWRVLDSEDPLAQRSKTKQQKLNHAMDDAAISYIAGPFLDQVREAMDGICDADVDVNDGHVIKVTYPAAFSDHYLRPEVRLEVGPLAAWLPQEQCEIESYAALAFPTLFQRPQCTVEVIKAERTFWEKATILHHEAYRPDGNPQPPRYSRHYYDLVMMAKSPVKNKALANPQLLADVADFKQRFYPRGWARYELARPGTLRLVPDRAVRDALETDYRAMQEMIFGKQPSFDDLMAALQRLEQEINGAAK